MARKKSTINLTLKLRAIVNRLEAEQAKHERAIASDERSRLHDLVRATKGNERIRVKMRAALLKASGVSGAEFAGMAARENKAMEAIAARERARAAKVITIIAKHRPGKLATFARLAALSAAEG